jgi:hypothetical protein
VTQERRSVISRTRLSQTLTFELVPSAGAAARGAKAAASLRVESRPPGANVLVDDRLVGKTPLQVGDLGPGEHAVRLELDGYSAWTASVNLKAGESRRLAASLDPR